MKVEVVLERLGGVATTAELRRFCSRGKLRVAVARGRVLRDTQGRYSLPGTDEALRAANRLSGLLCLDSAAVYHGWKVKHRPSRPAVVVPRSRKVAKDRREGVRLRYVDVPDRDREGPATGLVRTVMDCASRMPFDEALAIADSALRGGDVTRAQLQRVAQQLPARYRARCLRVVAEASPLADNPFESVLRAIALEVPGLDVRPQVWVAGTGRADLVDRTLGVVLEAESFEFHGMRRLLKRDCERYNAFVLDGWLVLRFAWEHVMFEPAYVRDVLVSAVQLLTGQPSRRALRESPDQLSA